MENSKYLLVLFWDILNVWNLFSVELDNDSVMTLLSEILTGLSIDEKLQVNVNNPSFSSPKFKTFSSIYEIFVNVG